MGSYSRKRYPTESASFPKSASSAPGSYSYATFADLPASGSTPGNTAFVVATNKLYIWNGLGWYIIATVTNVSPTAISGVDATYALATDGTATTITAVSTDPEGFALTWSYAVSSGSLGSTATIAQADNVFTITPSTDSANAGTFSLTFSVTDGVNGVVSSVSGFTLAFSIANSRYTVLSVKATATGSNQTFDDASASNLTISTTGNATASTFSPYRQGGFSAYFDGTGDYLDTGTNIHDGIGTGDFTCEGWFYLENYTSYRGIFGSGSTDANDEFTLMVLSNGKLYFDWGNAVSDYIQASSVTPLNIWNHISITRSGTSLNLWLNGTSIASGTTNADIGGSSSFKVGWARQQLFLGYIRDVRVVIGTAVYTSAFTPPTEPLTAITNTAFLLSDLPYFKDQSTSNHTITANGNTLQKPVTLFDNGVYSEADHGASAYFDGTGDYISAEDDASFSFGTGDFTVESWLYHQNGSASYYDLIGTASNSGYIGSNRGGWIFAYYHTHGSTYALKFGYQYNNAFPVDISFSKTLNVDTWYHIAMTRQGNQLKCFVNGIQVGSTVTNSTNIISTEPLTIGTGSNISTYVTGYMSDVRVVKGTAVYTSNFTPPTAPLTAITNTKFLLNPETSISDLSQKSTITCFGNTATSTTQVKFLNTRSIYGDGSGDYVSMPIDPIGTDDFTVEAWIYPTSMGATATAISGATINGGLGVVMRLDQWFIGNNSTNQAFTSAANKFVVNQWQHIAMTRQGTSLRLFYNGTLFDSGTNSYNLNQTDYVLYAAYTDGSYLSFAGHIQDFRITKGLARYTSTFTPPTTELLG